MRINQWTRQLPNNWSIKENRIQDAPIIILAMWWRIGRREVINKPTRNHTPLPLIAVTENRPTQDHLHHLMNTISQHLAKTFTCSEPISSSCSVAWLLLLCLFPLFWWGYCWYRNNMTHCQLNYISFESYPK